MEHAARLGWEMPPRGFIADAVAELVGTNDASDARLKLLVGKDGGRCVLRIMSADYEVDFRPLSVKVVPFQIDESAPMVGIKSTARAGYDRGLRWAAERGYDEAIFANSVGNLCEGARCNVFVRTGGGWLTPPLSSGCLGGVTRRAVLDVAAELGINIAEKDVPVSGSQAYEEAFATSALMLVRSVERWDDREMGTRVSEPVDAIRNRLLERMARSI